MYNPLTRREKEITALLALGYTQQEAAVRLGISFKTVETHVSHIYEKLNIHRRADLVRFAIAVGLVKAEAFDDQEIIES